MSLYDDVLAAVGETGVRVSEWLISDNGRRIEPPYVCVADVEGSGIYADGKIVIPIETVKVYIVYTPNKADVVELIKSRLEPYGYAWQKEKFSAERVMICTLTIEGG